MPRIVAAPRTEKADRSLCHFAVVGLDAASNRVYIQLLRLGGNPRDNSALWNSFRSEKQGDYRGNSTATGPSFQKVSRKVHDGPEERDFRRSR